MSSERINLKAVDRELEGLNISIKINGSFVLIRDDSDFANLFILHSIIKKSAVLTFCLAR